MKTYRDAVGRQLGHEEKRDNKIYLYDMTRRELGWYDIAKDETWQSYPRKRISQAGNLLAQLFDKKF